MITISSLNVKISRCTLKQSPTKLGCSWVSVNCLLVPFTPSLKPLKMSFKLGCTHALKVTYHPHPASATVNLKPALWFTYWVLVSLVVLTSVNRTIYKSLLLCGLQVECERVTMADFSLASSVERTNGAKLSRLLIDGGTTVLRNEFDKHHPPANLAADLNASHSILIDLLSQRVLNDDQWYKLFPRRGTLPDANTFDITLLFLQTMLGPYLTGQRVKRTLRCN